MLYRLAAVTLASTLLVSCGDESPFSDFTTSTTTTTTSGGGGGDGGTVTGTGTGGGSVSVSSIVRKTQIPLTLPDGMGGTVGAAFVSYDMGNGDTSISYILDDSTNWHIFRPDASGPFKLYSRPAMDLPYTTTSGDGNKILLQRYTDVVDYTDGNVTSIGSLLGAFTWPQTISDAGDVVAFVSNDDLAPGTNPAGVNQLFTLSTDGADTYNQITSFTNNHRIDSVVISGDGRRIFFGSNSDVLGDVTVSGNVYEVFAINTDSSGLAQLSNFNTAEVRVTRSSSDGSVIAVEAMDLIVPDVKHILAFNTATGTHTEIAATFGLNSTVHYDMSADGSRATYLAAGVISGTKDIYVVNTTSGDKDVVLTESGFIGSLQMNTNGSQVSFYCNTALDTPIGADEQSIQVYTMTL
ncbi:MAG: hypothetical protein HKP12_15565 [Gammaproteobacteria bacterium]|nr:hypothetical protein [Gammaproteobacteria bacterium]